MKTIVNDRILRKIITSRLLGFHKKLILGKYDWGNFDSKQLATPPIYAINPLHFYQRTALLSPNNHEHIRNAEYILLDALKSAGLDVRSDGNHVDISIEGADNSISQPQYDFIGILRVFQAEYVQTYRGIRIWRGTAFGYLDTGERHIDIKLGLYRNKYLVGSCSIRFPPTEKLWATATIKPESRIRETLLQAQATARTIAKWKKPWMDFCLNRSSIYNSRRKQFNISGLEHVLSEDDALAHISETDVCLIENAINAISS